MDAALKAALPEGSLAPRQMDASTLCGFREFSLLQLSARNLIAVDDDEIRSMRSFPAVSGHFSLPNLRRIAPASSIGTVLREPRARVLSLFLYWRTPHIFDLWRPYTLEEHVLKPLESFLAEPFVAPATDNQVCRMLLHGDRRIPADGFIAVADIDAVAADAIAVLDVLGFVGVLESGRAAWEGLERLFGVKLAPRKLNVTGEQGKPMPLQHGEKLITADALDLLEQRSTADRVLYDHALALAGVQVAARRRLVESAFAGQLARFGDLLGRSAAQLAEHSPDLEMTTYPERHKQLQTELAALRTQLDSEKGSRRASDRAIELNAAELTRLRDSLDATFGSMSWRITAPLRAAKGATRRLRSPWERI